MEKVKFVDPDTGESLAFFVVEETKEVETKDEESVYVLVEDDTELSAIGKVFAELLDDADIAF